LPTHKSAAKRMKTAAEARRRNRRVKSSIKTALKTVDMEKDAQKKGESVKAAISIVDKAAQKRVFHKNKAARIKSRLARTIKA